ncbi:Na+/H+ antiporter subunit G [Gaopeijia maritima]|uniref:Na+/H+ antiporter subunit G n=1 Tax=Gaopeijia maritima TaxID=3119007 RepID=A0ABU9EB20_9BACT
MSAEIAVSVLVVIGGVFTLIGSFGLARLPDVYMRLHGPTKATTLGAGATIVASMVALTVGGEGWHAQELLVALFLFLTAPVSAHLISRAALVRKLDSVTHGDSTGNGHRRPDDEPGADQPEKV